jgi:hypothetical protein
MPTGTTGQPSATAGAAAPVAGLAPLFSEPGRGRTPAPQSGASPAIPAHEEPKSMRASCLLALRTEPRGHFGEPVGESRSAWGSEEPCSWRMDGLKPCDRPLSGRRASASRGHEPGAAPHARPESRGARHAARDHGWAAAARRAGDPRGRASGQLRLLRPVDGRSVPVRADARPDALWSSGRHVVD